MISYILKKIRLRSETMKIIVLGSGMMGSAMAYDLSEFSDFDEIAIADKNNKTLESSKKFLGNRNINYISLDIKNLSKLKKTFKNFDIAISAIPYIYNYKLAKISVETKTHFLDLGGNNDIVEKERSLFEKANRSGVTIIPDCGLAPGLASVITRDVVEQMSSVDFVKIRVGGLPIHPQPPLNYQIVFSPYGLINEYIEDSIILENGNIIKKKSMMDLEKVSFPKPFGEMEAFLTSGGASTLPYTYKDKIKYLDYKTVRYPGHCKHFKHLLDLGLGNKEKVKIGNKEIIPRDEFVSFLFKILPINEKDVVLLKILSKGKIDDKDVKIDYLMVDYYDEKNSITAMMRTTSYPTSIIAQLIENGSINDHGVFGCEEVVPCNPFFKELKKRGINIKKEIR
jgi:lysine 6-dehydrogenase